MPDDLPTSSVEIFFSYSHKDEALREEMDKHLSSLWRKGVAKKWHDRRIDPGTEWAGEIDAHLNSAQIILLLITPDYMASDYCHREMTRALERHSNREARVIPIILRHVNWPEAPYSHLLVLPKDSKPVSAWPDRDEVFKEVANAITNLVDEPKSTWFDNYEPPEPPAERPHFWTKAPVWLYGLLALLTLALVFGVFRGKWQNPTTESDQTSQPAVSRDLSSDRNSNTNIQKPEKLAFAAGWSVALIGQSSKRTGNEVFGQALTELGFGATEAKEFDHQYVALETAARAQKINYQSFETAKSELLMKVDTRLRAFGDQHTTAYFGFGYDLGALRLLLKFWETLKTQGDLLSTVNDRLVSLQRSVKGVTVPASLSEKILALRPNDLTDDTYRISATQALDEVVTYFEMSPP
jgi:hypothetical protein